MGTVLPETTHEKVKVNDSKIEKSFSRSDRLKLFSIFLFSSKALCLSFSFSGHCASVREDLIYMNSANIH